jgi:hypothetical protein
VPAQEPLGVTEKSRIFQWSDFEGPLDADHLLPGRQFLPRRLPGINYNRPRLAYSDTARLGRDIMRIQGPAGTGMATPSAGPARRALSGTFSVNEHTESSASKGPSAVRTFGGIDALIALQGMDDATERRRQGVKRGRLALDALDELKIGLLGGTLTPATLNKLRSAAAFLKDGAGEAGLDGVLDEIELRVEVEIAKISTR